MQPVKTKIARRRRREKEREREGEILKGEEERMEVWKESEFVPFVLILSLLCLTARRNICEG
jgi:hypothetical protein